MEKLEDVYKYVFEYLVRYIDENTYLIDNGYLINAAGVIDVNTIFSSKSETFRDRILDIRQSVSVKSDEQELLKKLIRQAGECNLKELKCSNMGVYIKDKSWIAISSVEGESQEFQKAGEHLAETELSYEQKIATSEAYNAIKNKYGYIDQIAQVMALFTIIGGDRKITTEELEFFTSNKKSLAGVQTSDLRVNELISKIVISRMACKNKGDIPGIEVS